MEVNNYRLKILGKMSSHLLKDYLNKFRQIKQLPQYHSVLFCDRAELDIPISYKFGSIRIENSILKIDNIRMVSVTQQLFKPFDCIPAGWQPICEFDFFPVIPSSILNLPEIDDWYDRRKVQNVFLE